MSECSETICHEKAVVVVHWTGADPGPKLNCLEHANGIVNLSRMMQWPIPVVTKLPGEPAQEQGE